MPSKPLEAGDPPRIGRFELLGRLGEGGQGIVYLGRGPGPGEERVAVKVLRSSVHTDVLQRLGRELEAVHLVQPFVTARVIEAGADGERRYVVSEFIDGPSLQERVDARGPLSEGEVLRLAVGTATALTAIHGAGVVHRDFKPANVLLGPDGPRVVDFGIARLTDMSTITSGVIGTPSYMAPEQLTGERPSSAVDIFAWAVTIIYAATGVSAFGADTVPAVMHRILYGEPELTRVPPSLLPVLQRCLAKSPDARPSARDLLLQLVDPSVTGAAFSGPMPADAVPSGGAPVADPATPAGPTPAGPTPYPGQTSLDRAAGIAAPGTGPMPGGGVPPQTLRSGPLMTPAPRRPRRRAAMIGAVAVAAAALVAILVVVLKGGSPPAKPQAGGSSGPAVVRATTLAPTPATSRQPTSAPAAVAIPAKFAGTWSGDATMSEGGVALPPHSITFVFTAGSATASETEAGGCVNTLTLTRTGGNVLTFTEPQTAQCQSGTTTFTLHGASLAYRWQDSAGLAQQTGTLHRS